jgi:Uma2 family endonuclease
MGAEGEIERIKWTVADYHRMAEVGLLAPDARVELIDGEIVRMAPIGLRHADCVNRLAMKLTRIVGDAAYMSYGNPVRLSNYSEPQPDITLLARRAEGYGTRAPAPEDVLLAIEVAQSSLRFDLRVKVPLYARAKLHEVWIIDVEAERVHAFDQPVDGGYARTREFAAGERISIAALPTISVDIAELFNWSGR